MQLYIAVEVNMNGRKYNILYLNHVAALGGAEWSLLELLRNLDRDRFNPVLAMRAGDQLPIVAPAYAATPVVAVPIHRLKKTRNPFLFGLEMMYLLRSLPTLLRLLQRHKIDLIHANSTTAQVYALPAARLAGIPVVWHCRDLVPLGLPGKILCRHTTRILAISAAVKEHLLEYGPPPALVEVIYNGLDIDRFCEHGQREMFRQSYGYSPATFLIGMAGHLVPWKKHRLFLEAAARIAAELPAARFIIAGGDLFQDHPGYRSELQALAGTMGIQDKVTFTGYLADIVPFLEGLDLLLHPASHEPFGRIVAEAMALGKPVVAIDAAGPKEIIANGIDGLLVPADAPDALAAAVLKLAVNPAQCSAIGAAARERIRQNFASPIMANRIAALYTELLTKK